MGVFIIICVVIYVISKLGESTSGSSSSSSQHSRSTPRGSNNYNSTDYMGEFEIRARNEMIGDDKDVPIIVIEARGSLPVNYTSHVEFVTLARDTTDKDDGEPIFCTHSDFRDEDTYVFEDVRDFGLLSPNKCFSDWSRIGVAPSDALRFPRSGSRIIKFYSFMTHKASRDNRSPIVADTCQILYKCDQVGYKEMGDKEIEMIKASLNLGFAMAYSDGEFDKSEGAAIKKWVKLRVERLEDNKQLEAKKILNNEIVNSEALASKGKIDLLAAANTLRKSPIKNASYDALELCTFIMSADGVIKEAELRLLNKISDMLGIPSNELRGLIDKNTANAKTVSEDNKLTDELLAGIDPSNSKEEKVKKIAELFRRYNGYLNSEKDSKKRQRYQEMIDALARLKKKYG